MSSIMGHAGRLTRNCKLDREGSSTSRFFIPGHDGCWAFAALNNQNRIRSAVARIGPQFSPIWNSMRSVQWVVAKPVYLPARYLSCLSGISRIFRKYLSGRELRMNVNLENFGVQTKDIPEGIYISFGRFAIGHKDMLLQKFNFFLVFDNFLIFLMKLCDNGLYTHDGNNFFFHRFRKMKSTL